MPDTVNTEAVSDADKLAIQNAKRPSWKKVLLWIGVALLLLTGITIVLRDGVPQKEPREGHDGDHPPGEEVEHAG
jgi:hypothetical protein